MNLKDLFFLWTFSGYGWLNYLNYLNTLFKKCKCISEKIVNCLPHFGKQFDNIYQEPQMPSYANLEVIYLWNNRFTYLKVLGMQKFNKWLPIIGKFDNSYMFDNWVFRGTCVAQSPEHLTLNFKQVMISQYLAFSPTSGRH